MPVYYSSVDGPSIGFIVQNQGTINLSAGVIVKNASTKELSSSFTVQHSASANLRAAVLVQNAASVDISSGVIVQNIGAITLRASFTIRKSSSADLSSRFSICQIVNLSSGFIVRHSATKNISGKVQVRNAGTKNLSAKVQVRNIGTADLRARVSVRNKSSKNLAACFWVNRAHYHVERINHNTIQKEYGGLSIPTTDSYATVLEEDVVGYDNLSVVIAAGTPNDITYRIQGITRALPNVWAGIPSQVDVDVIASDIDNMGTIASFIASLEKIRVQVKNKTPGTNSRAWASLRATMGV